MNSAHAHLVVNHLPIIFPFIGVVILVAGILIKSNAVKRTALIIFIAGALSAIAAMSTGEGAEDIAENIAEVSHSYIGQHEEAAETFATLAYLLGGTATVALWASFKQKTYANILAIATLVFAVVVLFFAKQTATTGGEIRHTEIRNEIEIANKYQK